MANELPTLEELVNMAVEENYEEEEYEDWTEEETYLYCKYGVKPFRFRDEWDDRWADIAKELGVY